jgi:hypothetical protein
MVVENSIYVIKIEGRLENHWSEWFDELEMTYDEEGHTILSGPVQDQAALHGLLTKIRNLGLRLLSVTLVEASDE